jgi:hypothetical protein
MRGGSRTIPFFIRTCLAHVGRMGPDVRAPLSGPKTHPGHRPIFLLNRPSIFRAKIRHEATMEMKGKRA